MFVTDAPLLMSRPGSRKLFQSPFNIGKYLFHSHVMWLPPQFMGYYTIWHHIIIILKRAGGTKTTGVEILFGYI